MNKKEVLTYIEEHNKEHGGKLVTRGGFKKHFPELYKEMCDTSFPSFFEEFDFKQKLWHFLRDDYEQHLCKCGGHLKFRSFWYGYNEFCRMNCPAMIENQINMVKHKNESRTEEEKKEIQEKVKNTFLRKYGVERFSQLDEWKEKTIKKNREKFGKDWYSQTEQYRKEFESICKEKYGQDIKNPFQAESVKAVIKDRFYQNFLQRHPDVIEIKDKTLVCRCPDPDCGLCQDKTYEISKYIYSNRICKHIDTCTIRTPEGEIFSTPERELLKFIQSIYPGQIIENDRSVLVGKELDIFLPELNLAFEFNGVYWHNEFNKPKYYHQEKSLECLEMGVQLIHIWEDDWNCRPDVVKDFIKSKLHLSEISIGARKCDVRTVSNKDANIFLDRYHIQGKVSGGQSLGLYYKDNLVEIMTFGQLRKNMGGNPETGHYEIYRVCSKSGYNVQGGFSKLLKYFEDTYNPVKVITYANLDYTYGNVYMKCGFVKDILSGPTYTWVVDGIRRHRSNFQKSKLEECRKNPELTESEVMHTRGYWRCWDAGKIRFVKLYDKLFS